MSKSLDKEKPEFWVINISRRNVCLSDLALTIPARKSMNLLDDKHFNYSYEELIASMNSGSIHKKRHLIKVGKGAPEKQEGPKYEMSKRPIQIRKRSIVDITSEEVEYDELVWSDEQFANELSDDLDFDDWGK